MARNRSLQLAALATVAVPGLNVVATRPPQKVTADFRLCGVLDSAGRHWVVQAPLHAAAAMAMDAEVQVLRELDDAARAASLPFDVVQPEGFADMPEGWRAMVYRELSGRELDIDALTPGPGPSGSLARAIAAVHELDPASIADAGLPVYDASSYRQRRLAEVDDAARTGRVPPVLLGRWERALEDVALWQFSECPVHGDLAPENVLVSNGRVAAIINWSNAHVGDPAEDLAWLYAAAPEDSLDTIEEAYALARSEQPDKHLVDRALLYSELAVARWLMHGVRIENPEIISDAEGMLAELARQVADSAPIGYSQPVVQAWEVEGSLDPNETLPDRETDADEYTGDLEADDLPEVLDPDATAEIPVIASGDTAAEDVATTGSPT